jgi:glycine/D-amino acid oxidase-like deaminating enzyme
VSATPKKYCIIGQGLAGSVLGLLLMERGVTVEIFDDGHRSSSSIIAAGMWNPISFRKLILSWEADKFIPVMEEIYPRFEKLLGASFYHKVPLARLFGDHGSANDWDHRATIPEVAPYLSADQHPDIPAYFHQPHGHGIVNDCGWLDMKVFLSAARTHFANSGVLRNENFQSNPDDDPETMHVYCTGWQAIHEELFERVTITPHKGEVLTVATVSPITCMVNFGNFIVPLGNNLYRLGATHELDPKDIEPSAGGLAELSDSLKSVMKSEFKVVAHHAGFRPTTHDRKPVLGTHPEKPNVAIFNGLGARGVLQAPRMAQELIAHLLEGAPIRKEISILRFYKKK